MDLMNNTFTGLELIALTEKVKLEIVEDILADFERYENKKDPAFAFEMVKAGVIGRATALRKLTA